ncbi:MAG: hypothetical protein RBT36_02190 [Desulfobulbus sp.]|nr:hypothetical protein [Desulfobulbus sp.]
MSSIPAVVPHPEPAGTAGRLDETSLYHHQERGGAIITSSLRQEGAGEEIAERVRALVSRREGGGTDEQRLPLPVCAAWRSSND